MGFENIDGRAPGIREAEVLAQCLMLEAGQPPSGGTVGENNLREVVVCALIRDIVVSFDL